MDPIAEKPEKIRTEQGFSFHGKTFEYFRIWIVNTLLTIVTLGIYSVWAKVRTKRYFYGNTVLAGSSFDYTADPVKILKGRFLAVGLFAGYQLVSHFWPQFGGFAFLALIVLAPYVIVQSMRFRLYNSMWRGIRFGFAVNLKKAYWLFFPPIIYFAVLAILPFVLDVDMKVMNDLENGDQPDIALEDTEQIFDSIKIYFMFLGGAVLFAALVFPWWQKKYYEYIGNESRFGKAAFSYVGHTFEFYSIYIGAALIGVGCVISLLFFGFMLNLMMSFLGLNVFAEKYSWYLLTPLAFFLPYAVVMAYVLTQRTNVVYGNLELGDVTFRSELVPTHMMMLYATNTLAILCSLGFLIPWAMIRVAKYRASTMTLLTADLDVFIRDQNADSSAAGEEVGELFGLDIGL